MLSSSGLLWCLYCSNHLRRVARWRCRWNNGVVLKPIPSALFLIFVCNRAPVSLCYVDLSEILLIYIYQFQYLSNSIESPLLQLFHAESCFASNHVSLYINYTCSISNSAPLISFRPLKSSKRHFKNHWHNRISKSDPQWKNVVNKHCTILIS